MESLFKKRQERLNFFQKFRNKNTKETLKKEIPDNVFKNCDACLESIPYMDLMENLYVCPRCGHHLKITARERLRQIIDEKSFIEFDAKLMTNNIEQFIGYDEKLDQYKRQTGLNEAVITGSGKLFGFKVAICVMDSHFMMGSMGAVVGEKITRCIEFATKKQMPLIIFTASGGARMQEGIISLMQMAKTSAALKQFGDQGLLYITVLTHPTTGGVSASFAMLGDIILAEPKALVGFAGKRVIEKTINEVLPEEFQSSEFIQEKGFVDRIVERKDLKISLADLLMLHGGRKG